MLLIIGGLFATCYFVASLEPACSKEDDSGEYQGKAEGIQTHSTKKGATTTNKFSLSLNLSKAEKKQSEGSAPEEKKHWYEITWWKKLLCEAKIWDVLIVYFTYCLVVVGGFQGWYLWEAGRIGAVTASAAKKSADALPTIERGYLFLSEIASGAAVSVVLIDEKRKDGAQGEATRTFDVELMFTNHGRTPAIVKEVFCRVMVSTEYSEHGACEEAKTGSEKVVPSGGRWHAKSEEFQISDADFQSMRKGGSKRIFAYGEIHYLNIMRESCWTKFCWWLQPGGDWRPTIDPTHNDWK